MCFKLFISLLDHPVLPAHLCWASVSYYTKDMPHANAFIPLTSNQATEPGKVYLDCLFAEDIQFKTYVNNRET